MSISIQLYRRCKDISQNPCLLILCKIPLSKVLVGVLRMTELCCHNLLLDYSKFSHFGKTFAEKEK